MDGMPPLGWECDEEYTAWVTEENNFKIKPKDNGDWSGTVFYFSMDKITPNKGVYFTFKYTGNKESFTLGFDSLNKYGERIAIGEGGFHSVAMQMMDDVASAHILRDAWQGSNFFAGNLKLREDTWYEIALGFDNNNNYIIKIWQPETPTQQLTYFKKWEDFPHEYYFISWVSAKRSISIDDFTVFTFENFAQK